MSLRPSGLCCVAPEIYKHVIAAVGIEHLVQVQVSEEGKPYHRTGQMELSSVWITNGCGELMIADVDSIKTA